MNTAFSVIAVVLWLSLVRPFEAEAAPALKGFSIYLGGSLLANTVLVWMNLDKSTKRKWDWISMAFFAVGGILYASADANCLLWTSCSQDGRIGH